MAWAKNGSTTTSASTTLQVANLTTSKTNMLMGHMLSVGVDSFRGIRFNGDTSSNYAVRSSDNGGTDGASVNLNYGIMDQGGSWGSNDHGFFIFYVCSVVGKEKLYIEFAMGSVASGAGTAPRRREYVGKHTDTSALSQIDIVAYSGTGWGADSNLSVLGSELTPASATTIETNSIFIETDTALRYWFNGTNWISPYGNYYYTFDTDPTGSSPQTYFYVDTANSWWYGYSGTNLTSNQGQYIDLGSDLSTDWTMAFKVLTNQDGNTNALNAIVGLVLGSTTGTDYNNSVHDYVNLWFNTDSGSRRDIRVSYGINAVTNSAAASEYLVDGTGAYGGTTLPDATNTTLYVLVKKSGTTVTAELYTDSALQNQYGVTATLTSVSVSGLRYVKLMGRTASGTDNQAIVKIQSVQIKDGDANWTPAWIEG